MNSTDIIVLTLLGFFATRGFLRGLVQELFALGGIFALILFITKYVGHFQKFISESITPINYWVALVAGILLIMILTGIISGLIQKAVKTWNLSLIDRVLGFFLGIIFGIFFIFLGLKILLFIAESLDWNSLKSTVGKWINQSKFLQVVLEFLKYLLSKGT